MLQDVLGTAPAVEDKRIIPVRRIILFLYTYLAENINTAQMLYIEIGLCYHERVENSIKKNFTDKEKPHNCATKSAKQLYQI